MSKTKRQKHARAIQAELGIPYQKALALADAAWQDFDRSQPVEQHQALVVEAARQLHAKARA